MDDPRSSLSSALSTRSRASSIISTGTKTSITTLPVPQEEQHSHGIDVQLGQRNFRIIARPNSILSISSYDEPAPPYERTTPHNLSSPTPSPPLTPRPSSPSLSITPSNLTDPDPDPDPENALSRHYTNIVRTIDNNHAAEISRLQTAHELEIAHLVSQHAASLASTRHSIDAAYRLERKARERAFERSHEECAAEVASIERSCKLRLEEMKGGHMAELMAMADQSQTTILTMRIAADAKEKEFEMRVQKARNEVEDIWEGRWKEWMQIAQAEARRTPREAAAERVGGDTAGRGRENHEDAGVKKALEDRDGAWVRAITQTEIPPKGARHCGKQREAWALDICSSLNKEHPLDL